MDVTTQSVNGKEAQGCGILTKLGSDNSLNFFAREKNGFEAKLTVERIILWAAVAQTLTLMMIAKERRFCGREREKEKATIVCVASICKFESFALWEKTIEGRIVVKAKDAIWAEPFFLFSLMPKETEE